MYLMNSMMRLDLSAVSEVPALEKYYLDNLRDLYVRVLLLL